MTFPRKRDIVELMTTKLNIVEKYEGKWYVTHKFSDFMKKHTRDVTQDVLPLYSVMRRANPTVDSHITSLLAVLVVWDEDISEEDALEAAMFLDYWAEFGVCPFDRYGSEPVGVV